MGTYQIRVVEAVYYIIEADDKNEALDIFYQGDCNAYKSETKGEEVTELTDSTAKYIRESYSYALKDNMRGYA